MSRLGIMGGTFDPIHVGHIEAARAAMQCANLDRVLFIPSAQPPHRAPAAAPARDRLEMVKLALEKEPRFEVSDIEVKRGGPSYTVDTLEEVHRARPDDEIFLILGWDAARMFATWHEPGRVTALASIVIVARPGLDAPTASELTATGIPPARLTACMVVTPDVSGSALRQALAGGQSVPGKLPPAVEHFIAEHGLYGDNREVGT